MCGVGGLLLVGALLADQTKRTNSQSAQDGPKSRRRRSFLAGRLGRGGADVSALYGLLLGGGQIGAARRAFRVWSGAGWRRVFVRRVLRLSDKGGCS